MISQTQKFGKAIRPLFADLVTYHIIYVGGDDLYLTINIAILQVIILLSVRKFEKQYCNNTITDNFFCKSSLNLPEQEKSFILHEEFDKHWI